MTDRELLELAAMAAGIHATLIDDELTPDGLYLNGERTPDNNKFWNPLNEDGDALRLFVKLQLDLRLWDRPATKSQARVYIGDVEPFSIREEFGGDQYAATRRAIVRAAAAIALNGTA